MHVAEETMIIVFVQRGINVAWRNRIDANTSPAYSMASAFVSVFNAPFVKRAMDAETPATG